MKDKTVAILESRLGAQLADIVAKYGAKPYWAPALAEVPDLDLERIRALIDEWRDGAVELVVFQTGVGVKALFQATEQLGLTQRLVECLAASTVVVRGPKPTAELRSRQVRIDLSASAPFTTAEVVDAIAHLDLQGKTVLVQRYGDSNADLHDALRAKGAAVIEVATYRWALPEDTGPLLRLIDALQRREIDAVAFTSAAQAQNLFAVARESRREESLREDLNRTLIASIGPICTHALTALGVQVGFEAQPPKLGPLVAGLNACLSAHLPS
jgi:uroporphyrinogen-III synthase